MTFISLPLPPPLASAIALMAPIASVQGTLMGDEVGRSAPMSERRRREFVAGRTVARAALSKLGLHGIPLPVDPHGAPLWPNGVTGSIAHAGEMAIAVVSAHHDALALGVDLEPDIPLPDDAAEWVITPSERPLLAHAAPASANRWLFCAKECVHKALNPLNGAWLEFHEINIQPAEDWSSFKVSGTSASACTALQGLRVEGYFLRRENYVVALLSVGK